MALALAGSPGGAPPAGSQAARPAAQQLFEQGREVAYRPQGARADNWLSARQLFRQAIAADPRFAPAYAEAAFTHTNMVTSGLSLDREADLREAEALTGQAAVLAPDLPVVHAARAAVFRLQRRPAEALAAYTRAVELDPKQHASRANTGLMLILLGRPQEAIAPIQQTLALAPAGHAFTGTWLTYLGIAELQIGQAESAAERFRRSLTWSAFLSADTRRLYLSAALAQEGRQEEAEAMLAEVRARQPELTLGTLQQQELSDDPTYRRAQERFYRGLRAAGLPG
jgi:Tfp pilus assembly protein PilF